MDRKEFRALIETKMADKSLKQCAAFALRISFRILPFMARDTEKISTNTNAFWR